MCNCNKAGSASPRSVPPQQSSSPQRSNIKLLTQPSLKSSTRKKTRNSPRNLQEEPNPSDLMPIIQEEGTFAEKCQTFGYVLGLDVPVPENVLVAALENPAYAKALLMHRGSRQMFDLLNNPPPKLSNFSAGSLVSKAGKALLQWGLSGFPTVSKETLKRREDACLACPNLRASTSVLQKITASSKAGTTIGQRTANKSCGLCGCVVRNKMRLETETCPDEVKETPGINRWGENLPVK